MTGRTDLVTSASGMAGTCLLPTPKVRFAGAVGSLTAAGRGGGEWVTDSGTMTLAGATMSIPSADQLFATRRHSRRLGNPAARLPPLSVVDDSPGRSTCASAGIFFQSAGTWAAAPLPCSSASLRTSIIRRARVTSFSGGEKTAFASSICEGWIAHLPS